MKPDKWARIKARQRMARHEEPYALALKKARAMIDRYNRPSLVLILSGAACVLTYVNVWSVM